MNSESVDSGMITMLLERMRTQRLPRALDIKAKVDAGGVLDDFDIEFLEEVFADAGYLKPLCDRHPDIDDIIARVIHLYHEITEKALKNEERRAD